MSRYPLSALVMPVNSLMSAPAMKPLFLPESTTTPRGGGNAIRSMMASSSRRTWLESTLADVPGLSTVSHTIPSLSLSICHAAVAVSAIGSGRGRVLFTRAHVEVAHERAMIRIADVRHAEIGHFDPLAHQDEIELDARHACRKGRQARGIRAAQPRRAHEEVDLVRAPERIEVAGDDDGLLRLDDEIVERAQLVLPMTELQRQMHQEHTDIFQLELDDEPLDAGIEVVEALPMHVRSGKEGIALLAHDGHQMIDRAGAVFALVGRVVPELGGDRLGLVDHAGADRARVHLDEADDVRLLGTQELGDARQHLAIAAQIPGTRQRQVERRAGACGVADVVDDQTQREAVLRGGKPGEAKPGGTIVLHIGLDRRLGPWAGGRARLRRTGRLRAGRLLCETWPYVPGQSGPPLRHARMGAGRRLPAGLRVSRELAELLLPELQRAGEAPPGGQGGPQGGAAPPDRPCRSRDRPLQSVRRQPGPGDLPAPLRPGQSEGGGAPETLRLAEAGAESARRPQI